MDGADGGVLVFFLLVAAYFGFTDTGGGSAVTGSGATCCGAGACTAACPDGAWVASFDWAGAEATDCAGPLSSSEFSERMWYAIPTIMIRMIPTAPAIE